MALPAHLSDTLERNIPPTPQLSQNDPSTVLWIVGFSPHITTGAELIKQLASLPARCDIVNRPAIYYDYSYAILTFHEFDEALRCMDRFNYQISSDGRLLEMGFFCSDALYRGYPLRIMGFDHTTCIADIYQFARSFGRVLLVASVAQPRAKYSDVVVYFHRLTDLQAAMKGYTERPFGGKKTKLQPMLTDLQKKMRIQIRAAECGWKGVQRVVREGNAIAVPTNTEIGVVDLVLKPSPADNKAAAPVGNHSRPGHGSIPTARANITRENNIQRESSRPKNWQDEASDQNGRYIVPIGKRIVGQPSISDENTSKRQKVTFDTSSSSLPKRMPRGANTPSPPPLWQFPAKTYEARITAVSAPSQTPQNSICRTPTYSPGLPPETSSNSLRRSHQGEIKTNTSHVASRITSHDLVKERRVANTPRERSTIKQGLGPVYDAGSTGLCAPSQTLQNPICNTPTYPPRIPPETSSNFLRRSHQGEIKTNTSHVANRITSHDLVKESRLANMPREQSTIGPGLRPMCEAGNTGLRAPSQTSQNPICITPTYSSRIPPETHSNFLRRSHQTEIKTNKSHASRITSHDALKESLMANTPKEKNTIEQESGPTSIARNLYDNRTGDSTNPVAPAENATGCRAALPDITAQSNIPEKKFRFSKLERKILEFGCRYEFLIDQDMEDAGAPGESITPTHFAWGNSRSGEQGSEWTTTFHGCHSRDASSSILAPTPVLFAQWTNIPTVWQAGHCRRSIEIAAAGANRAPRSYYPFVSTQEIGGPITFGSSFEKIRGLCTWRTSDSRTGLGSEARSRLALVGANGIEVWKMPLAERRNSQGNIGIGGTSSDTYQGKLLEKFGFEQGKGRFGKGVDVWDRTVIGGGFVGVNNCLAIWLMQDSSAYTSRWNQTPSLCAPYVVEKIECIDNMPSKPIARAFRFNKADDGKVAVVATSTGDLLFWDWAARDLQKVGSAHNGTITSLDWSVHQPNYIVTGGKDKTVKIWDQRKMKDRNGMAAPISILLSHQAPVRQVRWCPANSNRLASSSDDGTVRIWDKSSIRDLAPGTRRCDYNVVFVHKSNRGPITDFEWHPNPDFDSAIGCVSSGIPSENVAGGIQVWQPRSMIFSRTSAH